MKNLKNREWSRVLIFLTLLACIGMTFMQAIPQDPAYHEFADARWILQVPHFWNVISNIPFLFIGLAGIILTFMKRGQVLLLNYLFFFLGIFLTGIGSAYYHLDPSNGTLVWDRLPMTIAFMSFFSIIITECIDAEAGKFLLFPLLILGAFAVAQWYKSEQSGHGDLRLYLLVQFLPMLLIPFILLVFKPKPEGLRYIWFMLLAYVIAKVFEKYDEEVYGVFLSGHTIKHFFAAVAPLIFLVRLNKKRSPR